MPQALLSTYTGPCVAFEKLQLKFPVGVVHAFGQLSLHHPYQETQRYVAMLVTSKSNLLMKHCEHMLCLASTCSDRQKIRGRWWTNQFPQRQDYQALICSISSFRVACFHSRLNTWYSLRVEVSQSPQHETMGCAVLSLDCSSSCTRCSRLFSSTKSFLEPGTSQMTPRSAVEPAAFGVHP